MMFSVHVSTCDIRVTELSDNGKGLRALLEASGLTQMPALAPVNVE